MNYTNEELELMVEALQTARVAAHHRKLQFTLLVKLQTEIDARADIDANARSDMQEPPA